MSSLFNDNFSFMGNCNGMNEDYLQEDMDWFFPIAESILDNDLDTININSNNTTNDINQPQQPHHIESNERFINKDLSFNDSDYNVVLNIISNNYQSINNNNNNNNNNEEEILTISEDLLNKKHKILSNKNKEKSSSPSSSSPTTVQPSTLSTLLSIPQSQISCTSTISQIAAFTENGSLGFSFPDVEIIPALIGGPWNNCDEMNSDDELDNEDVNCDTSDINNKSNNNSASKKKRKRNRPYNPDSDLIAAATEENLKLLNIDTNSKEGKVQRRKIRNRMSAQLHRERKKAYINYLENVIKHREANVIDLQSKVNYLTKESEILRNQLALKANDTPPILRPFFDYITSGNINTYNDNTSNDGNDSTDRERDITSSGGTSVSSGSDGSNDMITNENEQAASLVKSFGKGFPLFSIVLMMGFTLFNSPSPTSSLFDLQPSLNQLQLISSLQNNNMMNSEEKKWKYLEDASITNDKFDKGRVLLSVPSLPSSTIDNDIKVNELIPFKQPISEYLSQTPSKINEKLFLPSYQPNLQIPTITTSKALWKYQDRVLHLFPELSHTISNKFKNRKRNLRYRNNDNDKINNEYINDKLLISSSYPQSFDWISSDNDDIDMNNKYTTDSSGDNSNKVLPISRVFMSNGKALLDPSLTLGIPSSYITPETTSSNSLSTWHRGNTHSDNSNNHNQHQSKTVTPNVLYMLLPANQIRWGTSWSDSDGTMKAFLDNLNIPSGTDTYQDNGIPENSYLNSMFVEIGCSVFKAQLVNNVTVVK